jgi:chromosome segregation ATPase
MRGYSNIAKKSNEDLIQIVRDLKEQNNAKDKAIHYLKVLNEKIKNNQSDIAKTDAKQRPRSGNLSSQSINFMTIPKDKESLDDEIRALKTTLNEERADKTLLKTEFNRLREFVGKVKKERMSEARRVPIKKPFKSIHITLNI